MTVFPPPVVIAAEHRDIQERYQEAISVLDGLGISYKSHNYGCHLVIAHPKGHVDYWPSHGKWIAIIDRQAVTWDESTRFLRGILDLFEIPYQEAL